MKRIVISLFVLFLLVLPSPKTHADTSVQGCGQTAQSQVSAVVKVPETSPDIYVRATLPEAHGDAHLYFQLLTDSIGSCVPLGNVALNADWQKIASVPVEIIGSVGILTLTLPDTAPTSGASTPQAIFAPASLPCLLERDCEVTYEGSQFELSPQKISNSVDTLHVGSLRGTGNDAVKQVIYSVDGIQVYTKKTLEPFNESYVRGGEHSVERTVVLSSGQSLSDKKIVKKGNIASVNYLLISTYHRYLKLILFVGGLLAILVVWLLLVAFARFLYKRRKWQSTHIAGGRSNFDARKAGPQPQSKFNGGPIETIKEHKKAFGFSLGLVVALFLTYSFVLTTFTVDGLSMYPTLQDKSMKPLYILPATLGKITGNGYTPSRGTIVVIQKDENNLFDETAVKQKSYVVKRVVALPEERVVVKDGVVTVFNMQYPNGFVPDTTYGWLKNPPKYEFSRLDVTLKQGELFVIGDNRDNSIDSRMYGPIKATEVIGKVL